MRKFKINLNLDATEERTEPLYFLGYLSFIDLLFIQS